LWVSVLAETAAEPTRCPPDIASRAIGSRAPSLAVLSRSARCSSLLPGAQIAELRMLPRCNRRQVMRVVEQVMDLDTHLRTVLAGRVALPA